jgi:hypothetical protein
MPRLLHRRVPPRCEAALRRLGPSGRIDARRGPPGASRERMPQSRSNRYAPVCRVIRAAVSAPAAAWFTAAADEGGVRGADAA